MSSRPGSKAFLWIGLLLALGWLTFVTYQAITYLETEEMTMRNIAPPTLVGLAAVCGVVALLYGAVWGGKALMQWVNPRGAVTQPAPLTAEQIAERERTYALEIRAAAPPCKWSARPTQPPKPTTRKPAGPTPSFSAHRE